MSECFDFFLFNIYAICHPHKIKIYILMINSAFCRCKSKCAGQLTVMALPKSKLSVKPLAIFCGYTARFVSDLGPPKTGFVMSQVHYNRGFKISRIQFLMPVA